MHPRTAPSQIHRPNRIFSVTVHRSSIVEHQPPTTPSITSIDASVSSSAASVSDRYSCENQPCLRHGSRCLNHNASKLQRSALGSKQLSNAAYSERSHPKCNNDVTCCMMLHRKLYPQLLKTAFCRSRSYICAMFGVCSG